MGRFNRVDGFIDSEIGKAIVIGAELFGRDTKESIRESLIELKELAKAANIEVCDILKQKLDKIKVGTYVGYGKLDEVKEVALKHGADILLVDDELSGIQIRNMEEYLDMEIIDRTSLILDIFGTRAKTKEGKLQVELARLMYAKPREIGGEGVALSRQGGGIGARGSGEKKLEVDKRNIAKRISDVEKAIKNIRKQREVQRKKRSSKSMPVVALVGYTNAGKSSMMNHFLRENTPINSRSESEAKDMLFATLDPFHRKVKIRDSLEFILVDTVGFISKLPHTLVDAFMSTLEEVAEADLLLYIVDASNPEYEYQLEVTKDVVKELGASERPYIIVANKWDKVEDKKEFLEASIEGSIKASAITGEGIEGLIEEIEEKLLKGKKGVVMEIPFTEGTLGNYILKNKKIESKSYMENGLVVETFLDNDEIKRYEKYIKEIKN